MLYFYQSRKVSSYTVFTKLEFTCCFEMLCHALPWTFLRFVPASCATSVAQLVEHSKKSSSGVVDLCCVFGRCVKVCLSYMYMYVYTIVCTCIFYCVMWFFYPFPRLPCSFESAALLGSYMTQGTCIYINILYMYIVVIRCTCTQVYIHVRPAICVIRA